MTQTDREALFRRATEAEIRTAHAWVARTTSDWTDDSDDARQAEYERALEILIFANGGRFGPARPTVVCLCGSTRFGEAFRAANLRETAAGRIVLSIGCDLRTDSELWPDEAARARLKVELDELHKRKIDLADEVLVLNVGGYVGSSTASEIEYARSVGKPVRYLEESS